MYGSGPDEAQVEEALWHGLPVRAVHLQGSHQRHAAQTQEKLSQSQRFLPGIYIFFTTAQVLLMNIFFRIFFSFFIMLLYP